MNWVSGLGGIGRAEGLTKLLTGKGRRAEWFVAIGVDVKVEPRYYRALPRVQLLLLVFSATHFALPERFG
jgi:hypothetical protein